MEAHVAAELPWPEISIEHTIDRLEARAQVVQHGGLGQSQPIDAQYVHSHLRSNGVLYGIDETVVIALIEACNQGQKMPEPVTIARGTPPEPGSLGAPHPHVAMVLSREIIRSTKLTSPRYYHEFISAGGDANATRVDPGDVIFTFEQAQPGLAGTAIDGTPLEPGPPHRPLALGSGVTFEPSDSTVSASDSGLVLFDGQTVDVYPLNFDAAVEVVVSPDGMEAIVNIAPPGPGGVEPVAEAVREQLTAVGVKMGLISGAVEAAIAEATGRQVKISHKVAQGRIAQDGTDAWLEYLVDLDLGNVPLAEQRGRVDFKSLSVIKSVEAGQEIVRRHAGSKGTPGCTVAGKILPAYNGREVKLPRGRNVEPDPDDPSLLVAKVAGNIRASGGQLEVSECFAIKGDVDYGTGHIKYLRSVTVGGDIKAGFNMDVGGDLEVSGSVEDSTLVVGGNVLIRRGFVGQGQGSINAKGDVLIGFGRNQTIKCLGKLTVEREAINLTAHSRTSINVAGPLVGGTVYARDQIQCRAAGGNTGARTELCVGVDYLLLEQRKQLEEQVAGLRRRRGMLAVGRNPDAPSQSYGGGRSRPDNPSEQSGPSTIEETDALIGVVEERLKLLLDQAYSIEHPSVVVAERVFPGVTVKIGLGAPLKVTEELPGPVTFVLKEGAVSWR